ncbi:16072_t:CDS:2, partial [Funneliformis geosporum]
EPSQQSQWRGTDLPGRLSFKANCRATKLDPKPDRKKARGWEEKRSRTQINIHQPINGNGNVIGNTDSTINVGTSVATSKRGLNREKQDEVTKRTKIESQDLPTDLSEEEREPPNLLSPPHYILISSGIEPDEDDSSDEEEGFCLDINTASFDDYLDQNKRDSEWKLLDGRQLVKALNSKTPKWLNYFWKKTKKSKPYLREVSSGLSSIIDLSFEDGMCSWFEKDWANIKKKVYEIVDMEPKGFEGEVENVINTIEEENKLELSHSECAKIPFPTKIVHDRSKCLRTLKGILNNFLKEDLSDKEVRDSKILGIQFSGIELLDDGLYFGLEGPTFEFPTQLMNIKCLRSALKALFFFKENIVEKAKLQSDPTKTNHPLHKILHRSGSSKAKHFKI